MVDANGDRDIKISGRLWNHAMSEATYTLYEGDAAAFTTNTDGSQGMDRVSRLCLGCHDGSVALDAFGMDPAGTGNRFAGTTNFAAGAVANLGTNFRDDHPVGIDAMATNASGVPSGYLKTPTVSYNTTGDPTSGIKSVKFPVFNYASQSLSVYPITGSTGYFVSCKSCHTPHGTGLASLTPYPNLLNCDPAYLCNSCHYK